jgi:hypothetical protein
LKDIYQSLLIQSFKDFNWLIVDYGSENKVKSFVEQFLEENCFFNVEVLHRTTNGRYLTTGFVFDYLTTKYVVGLDGNYKLAPDTMRIIHDLWSQVESSQNDDIAEIRGHAVDMDGSMIGTTKFNFKNGMSYVDATWHEMVLQRRNYLEMLASWDREKFLDCVDIGRYSFMSDRIDELPTLIFWSAIGRKYKTRYLNCTLKIKLSHISKKKSIINRYNVVFGNYTFLKENIKYFWLNPRLFLRLALDLLINLVLLILKKEKI